MTQVSVGIVKGNELLLFAAVEGQSLVGPYPDVAVGVVVQAGHFVAWQTARVARFVAEVAHPFLFQGEDAQSMAYVADIEQSVASVGNGPDVIVGQGGDCLGVVVGESASALVQVVHSFPVGADPQSLPLMVGEDFSDVVRNQALRVARIVAVGIESAVLVVEAIQSGTLGGYPQQRVTRVVQQVVQFVAGQSFPLRLLLLEERDELQAVKLVQSLLRGKPQKALFVLGDADHMVVGQSLVNAQLLDHKWLSRHAH